MPDDDLLEEQDEDKWRARGRAIVTGILPQRIAERLKATKQSARAASLKAGLGPDAIRTILSGRSKSPRAENLAALAAALDCDVSYLLGARDEPRRDPDRLTFDHQPVLVHRYNLQLNAWYSGPDQHRPKAVSDIHPLPTTRDVWQHLELIEDRSFDRFFSPGTFLHVAQNIRSEEPGRHLNDGEFVILRRWPSRPEGVARPAERTVRVVRRGEEGMTLQTASYDPALHHSARFEGRGVQIGKNGLVFDEVADELFLIVGTVWRAITPIAGPPVTRPFTPEEFQNQEREDEVIRKAMIRIMAISGE